MEVRTELNSYQRELLMRMYRSRLNEEVFPVSFDMRGVGEALIACGLIVAVNGFYEFTEHGLKVWMAYGDNLNGNRHFHELKQQQKRKAEAERKKMSKEISLTDWEQKARENLSPTQIEALRMLRDMNADSVGVEVTRQQLNPMTRKSLEKYEMIKVDKHNRVWLLDAGYEKLMAVEASANSAGLDNADSPDIAVIDDEAVDALEHCDTCAGCVDHEVLHMLAQKFPAIARLRQSVLETRRLMEELGIDQK